MIILWSNIPSPFLLGGGSDINEAMPAVENPYVTKFQTAKENDNSRNAVKLLQAGGVKALRGKVCATTSYAAQIY